MTAFVLAVPVPASSAAGRPQRVCRSRPVVTGGGRRAHGAPAVAHLAVPVFPPPRMSASTPPPTDPSSATPGDASSSSTTPPAAPRPDLKAEDLSAMESAAALLLCTRAAHAVRDGTKRPPAADVEAAILAIEHNQRRARTVTRVRELAGEWELVLTAGAAVKGRRWKPAAWPTYFPIRARQTFTLLRTGGGTFDNAVSGLGCVFRFTGPFRWVGGGRNRAEFTFSTATLAVGRLPPLTFPAGGPPTLDGLTARTLPFFTFFFCRRGILMARGRGGGVALYRQISRQDLALKEL